MKEELVKFETAKLAKEKGFDVGVNQYYTIYKKSYNYNDPNYRESYDVGDIEIDYHYHKNNYIGIDMSNELYEAYSAPSQSLLQKWLREVYSLEVVALRADDFPWYKYRLSNITKQGKKHMFTDIDFDTYEEALEKGLQESLKLIK